MSQSLYKQLDAKKIVETAERIHTRILERFPTSGLCKVAEEVCSVARSAADGSARLARPYRGLRIGALMFTLLLLLLFVNVATRINFGPIASSLADFIQALDAGIESILFCGGGILFMLTLETRLKRRRALRAIHELRSLAHVVDMHQLTKDPDRASSKRKPTASSPRNNLDEFGLSRYLDYCSEMLSIISKVAALYVQSFPDHIVLDAVDEIESLTNGLSRKIWQKIMILGRMQ